MRVDEFLRSVVTTPQGYFCLATRTAEGGGAGIWREQFYTWPDDMATILAASAAAAVHSNVYFSAHLFSERNSRKAAALPSRTVQADLDGAEVSSLPLAPAVLVQTSPGRHQGYWLADRTLQTTQLETLGRRIAYGVLDCDRTGWPVGHKVRMPNTLNYKYTEPHAIEVTQISLRDLALDAFNIFPELQVEQAQAESDISWVHAQPLELDIAPIELLASIKSQINQRAYNQYTTASRDRSTALWLLTCECFRASLNRDQVYWLALHSANNKFDARYYNGIVDLRKDILRAESYVASRQIDLKSIIMDLRSNTTGEPAASRRKKITNVVIGHMREYGDFLHTRSGELWYLRRDTGRPIVLAAYSDWLNTYLGITFGLNYTEVEHKYVIQELLTFTHSLPQTSDLQNLSYFDASRSKMLLHTGGRSVLHIDAANVETYPNGYGNIVFRWNTAFDTFAVEETAATAPVNARAADSAQPAWQELLFKDMFYNVVGLTREEAVTVMRCWFLFLLFRNMTTTRPILALLGQPGSSKTTIAKILYRLIYGRGKSVSGLGSPEDFDMAVSSLPFVAFDNLDTWERWLPDRLAACTSDTDIEKRILYTNNDVMRIKRSALVGLTAHNPRFTREDVTDRLLLIMHQRLPEFKSDTEILERVSGLRNQLWTSIVQDIQRILATPIPATSEAPQFRIEDFSRLGLWFARAAGAQTELLFREAILKIRGRQRSFNLEEDQTLVQAIQAYLQKSQSEHTYMPIGTLYNALSSCSNDVDTFKRQYRNGQFLYKKLWVSQDSLRTLFSIDWRDDATLGARTWRIAEKETGNV